MKFACFSFIDGEVSGSTVTEVVLRKGCHVPTRPNRLWESRTSEAFFETKPEAFQHLRKTAEALVLQRMPPSDRRTTSLECLLNALTPTH